MGKRQQGCMPRLCRWQGKCFLLQSHLPASITFTCQKLCRPLHFNHRFSPAWPGGSTAPSTPCAPPHQQQGLTGTESLSQRGTWFRHCPRDQWLSKGAAPLHLLLYRVKSSSCYNAINSRSDAGNALSPKSSRGVRPQLGSISFNETSAQHISAVKTFRQMSPLILVWIAVTHT